MKLPAPSMLERAMAVVAPKHAARSYAARVGFMQAGQYNGARSDKTTLKSWNPSPGSADADTLGDLESLRSRARDAARNNGLARGARNTTKVNVVGTGLRLRSQLQREILGLSEEAAESWEDRAEVLFDLWASSKFADVTRTQNFYELQSLAFTSAFDSGDVFALRRYKEGGSFIALCLAMIEADRVATPDDKTHDQGPEIRDGVEINGDGEAVAYHVRNTHPGEARLQYKPEDRKFVRIPARGDAGLLMIHLFERERVGQSRGVPALAPIIEPLKQLDRYTEAELMAAVVSSFFTVFIKQDNPVDDVLGGGEAALDVTGHPLPANEVALGTGSVVELGAGESIETAQASRPNPNFDPFWLAMVRQIGVSLGIPYEVLIMHFASSYTASKAALEVAWQFFTDRRTWLERNFCQPVYEWFLYECVANGIITAPGFLEDPVKRAAWCGSVWVGPSQISLDPAKEAEADEINIDLGVETLESVVTKRNGGDWWRNNEQRGREIRERKRVGADVSPARPEVPKPEPKPPAAGAPK